MRKLATIGIILLIAAIAATFLVFSVFSRRVSAPTISTSTPPSATSSSEGTVTGEVVLGPTCPVEHNPPLPGCEPKPYPTTVEIRPVSPSESYAALNTDSLGDFKISLPPGTYYFNAQSQSSMPYPRCSPEQVSVTAGEVKNVTITCDTGIR